MQNTVICLDDEPLKTIELRRLQVDRILCYNVIFCVVDTSFNFFQHTISFQLYKKSSSKAAQKIQHRVKKLFSQRTVKA